MDILYYIGSGSHYNNQELRYSLRSLEKHCQDIGNVWIVGNRPHFLNDKVKYLWVEDGDFWWHNAYVKTRAAIEAGISADFLLMNDDFFILKDFVAAEYPYYHKGDMPDEAQNKYQKVIVNTKRILRHLNKTTWHYGVHCPIRINGEKYKKLEMFYGEPVSARCLYGNIFCHGVEVKDNKGAEIKESATGCFSSREWTDTTLFAKLAEMFPQPSRWEKENE